MTHSERPSPTTQTEAQRTARALVALRIGFTAGITLTVLLFARGLVSASRTLGPPVRLGLAAASCAMVVYGLLAWLAAPRSAARQPFAFRLGFRAGAGLAAIFAVLVFGEYLAPVTGRADELLGWTIFGGLLPLLSVTLGVVAALGTKNADPAAGVASAGCTARAGACCATWMMLVGSLGWIVSLLLAYLAFRGTAAEARLFEAEGVWADFARSGERDLRAFLITDYLGACFFHLALGPLLGAVFGAAGALGATAVLAVTRRSSAAAAKGRRR